MVLHGIPVSEGVAVGRLFLYRPLQFHVQKSFCPEEQAEEELARYAAAVRAADTELRELVEFLAAHDPEKAKIFSAHLDILTDVSIDEEIRAAIRNRRFQGDWAIQSTYDSFIQMLEQAPDALIRERAEDLKDVRERLLRIWNGAAGQDLSTLPGPVIVAAHDLLPSDTASMDRVNVLAILTETGGPTSHSAILARSYGIPAILGISGLLDRICQRQKAAVDARSGVGTLTLDPDERLVEEYGEMREALTRQAGITTAFLDAEGKTADGIRVEIGLNITSADAKECEGMAHVDYIGLFRTEFLYMGRSAPPDEEEQVQIYQNVLTQMHGRTVTLRTLDIGGDKSTDCLDLPKEENPFLGKRGLRLCFAMPELFRTQLRAALRASVFGDLWIMFPMVGSLEDFRRAKAILMQIRSELEEEHIPVSPHVKVGIMIEIPSIALMAEEVAREVDFASIGTNDLCQYTMAADRLNPAVSDYCQSYHPALMRLIAQTAAAFTQAGKPLSVCGELGSDVLAAPVLVGFGIRKLSMGLSTVARVKQTLAACTARQMERRALMALKCKTAVEVEKLLRGDDKS
ncbi:MAG: phosphoenolpyruvate--protein phosphotransferase [Lawsonibacter sp.]|nr:phosphoenolpyruvate--protein phosphotransferase [Lawsonibacter sp.]